MTLWLVRAGKYGEYERHFLDEGVVNLTWEGLENTDLRTLESQDALKALLQDLYPDDSKVTRGIWSGQIWTFAHGFQPGDWVGLPRKTQSSIAIGEILSSYEFHPEADPMERHVRRVRWINEDVPRSSFSQDLLYSFGSLLTICRIKRNDAEARVRAMAANGWIEQTAATPKRLVGQMEDEDAEERGLIDLEQVASDQIAKIIQRQFAGHGLARLVAAVLEAQGYSTHVSPPGPDKGIDILAAPDALGFGSPRVCVQVKSGDTPVDRPTLDQLIGVMQNVHAEQGLLVSWGGFKKSVEQETASQFFRVRLWGAKAVVENLLAHYDRLPTDIRAELPLKQIWTVATQEIEESVVSSLSTVTPSAAA